MTSSRATLDRLQDVLRRRQYEIPEGKDVDRRNDPFAAQGKLCKAAFRLAEPCPEPRRGGMPQAIEQLVFEELSLRNGRPTPIPPFPCPRSKAAT